MTGAEFAKRKDSPRNIARASVYVSEGAASVWTMPTGEALAFIGIVLLMATLALLVLAS
jgi:hypothetical protein